MIEKLLILSNNIYMAIKLKLDSEYLTNEKLPISSNGYDALAVDTIFDKIIKDYETIENGVLLSKEEYESLINKIKGLEKSLIDASIEVKSQKDKWKYVCGDKNISSDNFELLKRIGKLESIIHEKLRLSLEEINSFDPDDC